MPAKRLHIIMNSHMDPVWLWRLREGRAAWLNTCRSVVRMMKRHPFLKFTRSSSAAYKWIEESDPKLFNEIRKLVAANRWEIVGGWVCGIAEPAEYPEFRSCDEVNGLGNISVPGILPRFSGTVRYEGSFDAPGGIESALLDLGGVYETAAVHINGRHIGTGICPPYAFALPSGLLTQKNNRIAVEVTNTLAKRLGGNQFDRAMPQEPSGLLGPVRLMYSLKGDMA